MVIEWWLILHIWFWNNGVCAISIHYYIGVISVTLPVAYGLCCCFSLRHTPKDGSCSDISHTHPQQTLHVAMLQVPCAMFELQGCGFLWHWGCSRHHFCGLKKYVLLVKFIACITNVLRAKHCFQSGGNGSNMNSLNIIIFVRNEKLDSANISKSN